MDINYSPLALSAHSSHPGVFDPVDAAGAVGHLRHLHHHSYFLGRPGATDCGLLLHPEVLPGGLQVSVVQLGQSSPHVEFRGPELSLSLFLQPPGTFRTWTTPHSCLCSATSQRLLRASPPSERFGNSHSLWHQSLFS